MKRSRASFWPEKMSEEWMAGFLLPEYILDDRPIERSLELVRQDPLVVSLREAGLMQVSR